MAVSVVPVPVAVASEGDLKMELSWMCCEGAPVVLLGSKPMPDATLQMTRAGAIAWTIPLIGTKTFESKLPDAKVTSAIRLETVYRTVLSTNIAAIVTYCRVWRCCPAPAWAALIWVNFHVMSDVTERLRDTEKAQYGIENSWDRCVFVLATGEFAMDHRNEMEEPRVPR